MCIQLPPFKTIGGPERIPLIVGERILVDKANTVWLLASSYKTDSVDKYGFRVKKLYNEPGERALRKSIISTLGKIPIWSIGADGRRIYHI